MKKNKLLVILSLALTLSCLFSALSMNSFALEWENLYYVTNRESTAVTNTYGYSSANFTGNFYGFNDSRNDAILAVEAYGGRLSDFVTELYAAVNSLDFVDLNSGEINDRTLSATFRYNASEMQTGSSARTEQSCTGIFDADDKWQHYYYSRWMGGTTGWGTLNEAT